MRPRGLALRTPMVTGDVRLMETAGLHVVASPIGNLRDVTLRAIETLHAADLIAAEDTRHTRQLLRAHGIDKPLVSLHAHNEAMRSAELIERMLNGANVAFVTDAGMPGISDPGRRLVNACHAAGVHVTVLPGPSAVTTAVAGAGFGADAFYFGGFLPVKSGQRMAEVEAAFARCVPSVYFESPHRLVKTLAAASHLDGTRMLCVCRELTKIHEEFRRDTAANLLAHYSRQTVRGEITLVISPNTDKSTGLISSDPSCHSDPS